MTAHAAAGTARVVNCGTQLYIASVKNNNGARMQPLAASGSYSEPIVASNNGVAIKVARSASGPVVQFEYTLGTNGQLSYDTSNIDGNPFAQYGTRLVPGVGKSSAFPTCVAVDCPPGAYCDAAYNLPDDVRTMVCPGSADLVFTVCSGAKIDGGGRGSTGSGSGSAANGAALPPPPASPGPAFPAPATKVGAPAPAPAGSAAAAPASGKGGTRGSRWSA